MTRVCSEPGCPALTITGRRCPKHASKPWAGARTVVSRAWAVTKRNVLLRDRYRCQPCKRAGKRTRAHTADHIIPVAEGGSEDLSNLEAICNPCHDTKSKEEARRGRVRAAAIRAFDA